MDDVDREFVAEPLFKTMNPGDEISSVDCSEDDRREAGFLNGKTYLAVLDRLEWVILI